MKKIKVPKSYNYVAAFLTMRCNLSCSYCINAFDKPFSRTYHPEMSAKQWKQALNRLDLPEGLPITIQGGEPTVKRSFHNILMGIKKEISLDMLTNGQFDINKFIYEIPPSRFRQFNDVKDLMASIRLSYHPEQMDLEDTIKRALILKSGEYAVGISIVSHPNQISDVYKIKTACKKSNILFWEKEFLGFYDGKLYGTYKYLDAMTTNITPRNKVECKVSELLIAPTGHIYRCHRDLYAQENPIGNILDEEFEIEDVFRSCNKFGHCNPCDIKLKTNRFLKPNYCAVKIRGSKEK